MADRVGASAAGSPPVVPATVPAPAPAASAPTSLKHCWVTDAHGRLPALLLEWRRTETGYQGRVVRPVLDDAFGGWVVVEEWLPAAMLEPA